SPTSSKRRRSGAVKVSVCVEMIFTNANPAQRYNLMKPSGGVKGRRGGGDRGGGSADSSRTTKRGGSADWGARQAGGTACGVKPAPTRSDSMDVAALSAG